MPAEFFDTSVLVYLISDDTAKAERVETLIANSGIISVQVLNELANTCRRKAKLNWEDTHMVIGTMRDLFAVSPLTVEIHELGLAVAERHQLSIYDAMIVAAALETDCKLLWSEDMQDGMKFDVKPYPALKISNPFR